MKRREGRSKGEKERYTYLNEESQRISRKDKKALFSDQCKEIEANNRIGKTKDFFKKIRETKGTFVPKDGHNEGHKILRAEDIKKRIYQRTVQKESA